MKVLLHIFCFIAFSASAQLGSFQSLNLPFGARNAAMGGHVVSLADGDVMQFAHNPALLDSVRNTSIGLNISPMFAGITAFDMAYTAYVSKLGKLGFGLAYVDYGDFQETAANGDQLGEFAVNDLLFSVSKSHQISAFTLGMTMKYATSTIAGYGASMILGDIGGLYRSPKSDFTVGMVFKNFGFIFSNYTGSQADVPFDVLISTSFKPEHMPFRFSISSFDLTDNYYYMPVQEGTSRSKSVEIADKIMRKINVGGELILHESMQLLFGYSHLRHQELAVNDTGFGAGFSFGAALRIKNIRLRYSHANYHAAGGTDFFTLESNIQSFKKIL